MDLREIASAYQSIYLNEEVEEELILEDLSQDEVDNLVEEIYDELLEEGFSLEEIDEGFEDYISEDSEVLSEERAAKKAGKGAKSYDEVKAEIDAKEKAKSERKAARKQKVEDSKKAAKVVRPSEKLASASKKASEGRKALPPKGGTSAGSAKAVTQRGATRHKQAVKTAATVAGAFMKSLEASEKAAKSEKRKKEAVKKAETAAKGTTGTSVKTGTTTPIKGQLPASRTVTKGEKRKKAAEDKKAAAAKGTKGTETRISRTKGGAIVKRNETIGPKAEIKKGVKKAMEYRLSKKDLKRSNRRDNVFKADTSKKDAEGKVIPSAKEPKSATDRVKDAASAVRVGTRNLKRKAGSALGSLAKKLSEEGGQLDSFDTVIAYLIDEEIASDFTEATAMMAKLSEGTIAKIHSSQLQLLDEAVYGGGKKEEKKDTRMIVTNADKKGNTPAYQNYMKGDKRYKAADHMKGDK